MKDDGRLLRASVGLALLRLWAGVWFLLSVHPKLPLAGLDQWAYPAELQRLQREFIEVGALSFYVPVLEVFVEHPRIAAELFVALEALAGGLLVTGFFTRAAAGAGMLVAMDSLFSTARIHRAYVGLNLWILAACAMLLIGRAGVHFGIDGLFARTRRPG